MRQRRNFFSVGFEVSTMFLKKVLSKNKLNQSQICNGGPTPPKPAKTHGGQDMTKSLREPCAKVRQPVPKLSNEAFSKVT